MKKKSNTKSAPTIYRYTDRKKPKKHVNAMIILGAASIVLMIIFTVIAVKRINEPEPTPDPETIADSEADAAQKEYADRDVTFTITPKRNYSDGYFVDATWNGEGKKITLTISLLSCSEMYREESKEKAHSWLKRQGINLEDYEVVYRNKCTE